jgi:hypothetical protein
MLVLASRYLAATLPNRLVPRRALQQADPRQRQQRQPAHHSRRQRQQAAQAGAASSQQQALQPNPPSQKQPAMYFLVRNEEVLPCQQPSGAWLEAAPRGECAGPERGGAEVLHVRCAALLSRPCVAVGIPCCTAAIR